MGRWARKRDAFPWAHCKRQNCSSRMSQFLATKNVASCKTKLWHHRSMVPVVHICVIDCSPFRMLWQSRDLCHCGNISATAHTDHGMAQKIATMTWKWVKEDISWMNHPNTCSNHLKEEGFLLWQPVLVSSSLLFHGWSVDLSIFNGTNVRHMLQATHASSLQLHFEKLLSQRVLSWSQQRIENGQQFNVSCSS